MVDMVSSRSVLRMHLVFIVVAWILACVFLVSPVCGEGKTATNLTIGIQGETGGTGPLEITGQLTGADGTGLGNKRVILESSGSLTANPDGFASLEIQVTGRSGEFRFFRPAGLHPPSLRVRFSGNDQYLPSVSPVIDLQVPAGPVSIPEEEIQPQTPAFSVPDSAETSRLPTALNITISPSVQAADHPFEVIGNLTGPDGEGLGNKRVILESSRYDSPDPDEYAFLALKVTSRSGAFRFYRPAETPPEFLRVTFAGNDEFQPSESAPVPARGAGTDDLQIRTNRTGSITVSTKPQGADIYINGEYQGLSYRKVSGLPEGPHVLTIAKIGYQNQTEEAYVTASRDAYYEITLSPLSSPLLRIVSSKTP